MSFQLSILKILAGQPNGRASVEVVKRYLSIFYTSGSEWTDRMKRLAERAPGLDIFSQKLITREPGEWIITEAGREVLASLEASPVDEIDQLKPIEQPVGEVRPPSAPPQRRQRAPKRRRGKRARDLRSA